MRISVLIIAMTLCLVSFGQKEERSKEKHEQIAAQKAAYLTKRMALTPEEAKVFWPVYDQYDGQLHKLRQEHRQNVKEKGKDLSALSDAEVEELIDREIGIQEEEMEIKKKMHTELKEVVGARKVAMLYRGEREFHRELLHRLKEGQRKP